MNQSALSGSPRRALSIIPFRGFGHGRTLWIKGRVVRGCEPANAVPQPAAFGRRVQLMRRLRRMLRLAFTRRLLGVRVRIECAGETFDVAADAHGYYACCVVLAKAVPPGLWLDYQVELIVPRQDAVVRESSQVLLAAPSARRLIISDVDDTVMLTGVSRKLLMFWRLFAEQAEERRSFPGSDAFYYGLHRGGNEHEQNPIVYVSRAPWSIYPTLSAFFQRNAIPVGPVLQLRDWGITLRHPFPRRARSHKRDVIIQVLETFTSLPAILIGDSGQHDPELYEQIVEAYPGRILAIYIRDLEESTSRSYELGQMAARLGERGVVMYSAPTTEALAGHALARGWLWGDECLSSVRAAVSQRL